MKTTNAISAISVFAVLVFAGGCDHPDSGKPQERRSQQKQDKQPPAGATISLTRNFYVVFDDSGSMSESYSGTSKMEAAKTAAREFLNNVPEDANIGLYFLNNGEAVKLGPKNANRDAFAKAINRIDADGGTPLGYAIEYATEKLANQRDLQMGYGEFRMIVITDGESSDNMHRGITFSLTEKIPLYTIGVATGKHSLSSYSVSFAEANNLQELKKALLETLAELPDFSDSDFNQ